MIAGISLTGVGSTLRGGDETGFLASAHQIAHLGWTSGQWLPTAHASFLHVLVFAAQIKLLSSTEGALRITQVGISLAGILLIAASVYNLAGSRAARLAAWLMCLEVSSLFFNELLHKDPLMELASGLVVFGGTRVWTKLDLRGFGIMLLGALIALATRQYVGWFLMAGALLLTLHASLRQLSGDLRTLPLILGLTAVIFVAIPAVVQATSHLNLEIKLQASQNANAAAIAGNGGANGNNLALEQVNFSTRGAIITSLPRRIFDVLVRPYPWQVGDVNQTLGVVGSLIALTCFYLLIRYAVMLRGEVFARAGPLLYPFFFLLIAYALSVGNAGTGFRYRTHLVTLALAAMVVLREAVLETEGVTSDTSSGARLQREPPPPRADLDRTPNTGAVSL